MRLTLLFLLACLSAANAESNSKGPNSPIVVGKVIAVGDDEESVTILQEGGYQRVIPIPEGTKVAFVGMPKKARELTVGYGAKASLKGNNTKYLKLTLPLEESAPLGPERTSMDEETIFSAADANGDRGIDYVEMSRSIYHSPKHGPDRFQGHDEDADGLLDENEFSNLLANVTWWKFSRQSPAEWFAQGDADGNGSLNQDEFGKTFDGGSHTATRFKRADSDKNGSLNETETAAYVARLINAEGDEE
ncbi:MAG: hypothetical protein AAGD22_16975 [Verrucomicrobiota bacterium]